MSENAPRSSRLVDLAYRFLLWFSVSFALHYLAALSNSRGGQRLAAAMRKPPSDDYALVIFGVALLLFVVALMMKDVHHLIRGITLAGRLSAGAVALVAKVSSDLLISIYGMGSFVVGWMVYDGFRHFKDFYLPSSHIRVLGLGLYEFTGLVIAIGLLSAVVRVDEEGTVVRAWYRAAFIWRLLAYLTAILALYEFIWIGTRWGQA